MNTNAPLDTILRHGRFYLRHHSPKRLKNLALTLDSLIKRPLHAPNMPISLKVEPSAMCQLACPGCVQANPLFKIESRGKVMNQKVFESLLDQAGDHLYRIQFYDQGEPFTNKRLLQMIASATRLSIGSQVSTNFSFTFANDHYRDIVESGLEHLIVAMDGVTSETYSQYRVNGRFDVVESGLRQVVKWKRRLRLQSPFVEWQFIVFDHNRHEIEMAKKMAREIGVDRLCLKYDAGGSQAKWNTWDRLKLKCLDAVRLNSCLWLWGSLVMNGDGIVSPCCNAARSEQIGDLKLTSLPELWNSEKMKALRAYVRSAGKSPGPNALIPACANCPHVF